jgi:hypothetical protein
MSDVVTRAGEFVERMRSSDASTRHHYVRHTTEVGSSATYNLDGTLLDVRSWVIRKALCGAVSDAWRADVGDTEACKTCRAEASVPASVAPPAKVAAR